MTENEVAQMRLVRYKDSLWLNSKDIADFLSYLAATEETDTRERLEKAAQNIRNMKRFRL